MMNRYEVWALTPAETEPLEKFQRKVLKQLQGLSDGTATAAVHILSGVLPIAASIYTRTLTFFRHTVNNPKSVEHELARQELALKDDYSNSWYIHVERIANPWKRKMETAGEGEDTPILGNKDRGGSRRKIIPELHELQTDETRCST